MRREGSRKRQALLCNASMWSSPFLQRRTHFSPDICSVTDFCCDTNPRHSRFQVQNPSDSPRIWRLVTETFGIVRDLALVTRNLRDRLEFGAWGYKLQESSRIWRSMPERASWLAIESMSKSRIVQSWKESRERCRLKCSRCRGTMSTRT